jgi:glycosyltransferase involved in cell wall biosynthesis
LPTLVLTETTPGSFQATRKPAWRTALLRWLLGRCCAALYIGSRNRAFLDSMGVQPGRLFSAPYSVDNSRLWSQAAGLLADRRALCSRYGLDPDLPVYLFCGKLNHKKRPLELLEAYLAAGLQDRAQLVFVGDGALRESLRQRAEQAGARHVHLLGFFNQTQMPVAYALGEVLCLISDPTETWGLVVNEALACARPAIVSDAVGCAPDLVTPANGWTTPLDNPAALAKTLRAAYERRADWPAMGREGQRLVAAHTFKAMACGVTSALEAVGC